jgi:oligopeptidase B
MRSRKKLPRLGIGLLPLLLALHLACATGTSTPHTEPAASRPIPGRVATPAPPEAKRVPHEAEVHGDVRVDPYYWLKERDNPEVIDYLEAENAYTDAVMAHTAGLQDKLYREIVGRLEKTEETAPYRIGDYFYYTRFEKDADYPLYCRKHGSLDAEEEVLLDAQEMSEGHDFFALRGFDVSPDHRFAAFGVDTFGRRLYTLRFKDLASGELLDDALPGSTGNGAWANDGRTFFYTRQDPETLRWDRIYRHRLGSDPAADELVYEEPDETFNVAVAKTRSKRYLVIAAFQTLSSEFRYLDADDPDGEFQLFQPRRRDLEYSIDHHGDHFYVRTNLDAKNFRLMRTPVDATGVEHWEEVVPHREEVLLDGFEVFEDYLVLIERRDGLIHLHVRRWDGGEGHDLDFGEPVYTAFPKDNHEYDTEVLRYRYTSLTTPWSTYDYDMGTREKTLRKQQKVLGGFDPADYRTERLYAPARDGRRIPISIVYRKDFEKDGSHPLLLYGYGSYGYTSDATFAPSRLSLLDRGFAYAIAHVRGGQLLGREWYEEGRLLRKKNTFFDFIDSAEYLVAEGYTRRDRLFAQGGSAGGLLVGAVVTLRPDLFHGAIANVPFVDVINTMLDPDIPLTTAEYDEWGDPRDPEYYAYMLSYSPYDNVEAVDYPNLLVTTGLHDSQVQYWEPAKWVAKLRATKTDSNLLLLKTNMAAGHGGASGRYKQHHETALAYAFLLDLAGITE